MKGDLPRHTWVWPTGPGYAALASGLQDPGARAAIDLWSASAWPFIVRRSEEDETSRSGDPIAVGLALPPSLGKHRLQFRLMRHDIAVHAPPLALDDVIALSSPTVRRKLTRLARAAARAHLSLHVFGSAAWQAQTGFDYMNADSDIDLLVHPNTRDELNFAIAWLERAQRRVAMRLDGEIVFPGGDAVAWREWAGNRAHRVLVKNIGGVAMVPRSDLLHRFEQRKRAA